MLALSLRSAAATAAAAAPPRRRRVVLAVRPQPLKSLQEDLQAALVQRACGAGGRVGIVVGCGRGMGSGAC